MFGAFIALLMTSCYNGNSNENATSSPSFDEVLTSRRSVRNYDASKKITEAEVRDLIKATQEAPSWANQRRAMIIYLCLATFCNLFTKSFWQLFIYAISPDSDGFCPSFNYTFLLRSKLAFSLVVAECCLIL